MMEPVLLATTQCTDVYRCSCEAVPGYAFDIGTKSRRLWFPEYGEAVAARQRWISWRSANLSTSKTSTEE